MKRRSFLGLLAGAAVAPFAKVVAAQESAKPLEFAVSGIETSTVRSYTFNPQIFAKYADRMLQDDDAFRRVAAGSAAGMNDTITILKPARFTEFRA